MLTLDRNPSRGILRLFAGVWLPLTLGLAGYMAWRHNAPTVAWGVWIAAAVLSAAGLIMPPLIRPVYIGLMVAFMPLGWVMSYTLASVFYFVVITPIGLLLRLFGYDPLERKIRPDAETYWSPAAAKSPRKKEEYFKQF